MRYIEVEMIALPNINHYKLLSSEPGLFREVVEAIVAHVLKIFHVLQKFIPISKLLITIVALQS